VKPDVRFGTGGGGFEDLGLDAELLAQIAEHLDATYLLG
jgi:hypothetical protein